MWRRRWNGVVDTMDWKKRWCSSGRSGRGTSTFPSSIRTVGRGEGRLCNSSSIGYYSSRYSSKHISSSSSSSISSISSSSIRSMSSSTSAASSEEGIKAAAMLSREARRQMRTQQGTASAGTNIKETSALSRMLSFAGGVTVAGVGAWFGLLDTNTKTKVCETLNASPLGDAARFASVQIAVMAKPFTDPSRDKLLPDWPIPGVPAHVPAPPTLILALEDTLVHSEWDRRHGWRHAKRPGVDKFLEAMCRHYEIVIFSKQMFGIADDIVNKLDSKGFVTHRLYRDATRFYNGTHVKDLTSLNRSLQRAIIIDDDPAAYQLQPRNAIPVKPFVDVLDKTDSELEDLIPFLQAMARENVSDFRDALDSFRESDGIIRDLPSKYQSRVHQVSQKVEQKRKRGLGGLIRGRFASGPAPSPPPLS